MKGSGGDSAKPHFFTFEKIHVESLEESTNRALLSEATLMVVIWYLINSKLSNHTSLYT